MHPRVITAANMNVRSGAVVARAVQGVVICGVSIRDAIDRIHAIDTVLVRRPPIGLANRASPVAALATYIQKRKATAEVTAIVVAKSTAHDLVLVHMKVAAPIIGIVNFIKIIIIFFFLFPTIAIAIFRNEKHISPRDYSLIQKHTNFISPEITFFLN